MPAIPPQPLAVGGIPIPQDDVSRATWSWAQRALPRYLLGHSVRTFCWGVTLAGREGWTFDPQILWTASLLHDGALRHLPRNTMCFEIEGAEFARRFLERNGLAADAAERVAIAIILHMRSGVTLDDGVESVLLDRATGLDVRGDGYPLVDAVRPAVMRAQPRGDFDRWFLDAMRREASRRPTCQSARLVNDVDLAGWMARSPWASRTDDFRPRQPSDR